MKLHKKDGTVQRVISSKKRRFFLKLQVVPESEVVIYELSVTYRMIINIHGEKVIARNEGEYAHLKDLLFVYHIFTDQKEIDSMGKAC